MPTAKDHESKMYKESSPALKRDRTIYEQEGQYTLEYNKKTHCSPSRFSDYNIRCSWQRVLVYIYIEHGRTLILDPGMNSSETPNPKLETLNRPFLRFRGAAPRDSNIP